MTEHKPMEEELSAEELQKRLAQIEAEAEQLAKMQQEVNKDLPAGSGMEDKEATDARSVHIGNVDYSSTPEELQEHFKACGVINRITILCDKFGNPKG
jgi:polyadenylate-binding protein 2